MLESSALTDAGRVRPNNQDSFLISPELGLYIVADGMGGARGGARASSLTVETVRNSISRSERRDAAALLGAVEQANDEVLGEATRDPGLEGMGTTVVAALNTGEGNDIAIASVGDSRAYLVHEGELRAITTDQTWVEEVGRGLGLDDAALRKHPMRHVLTMAVGVGADVRIQYYAVQMQKGDLVLLSSDGLHGVVQEPEIRRILVEEEGGLESKCSSLVRAAHDAGSPDNVTVVLLRAA